MDVESATLATGRAPEAMRETTPRWPTKKVGCRHQHIPPATQTRPVSNIHINRQRTTQRPHLGPIGSGRSQLVDPREPVHQRRVTTIRRHPQPGLPPPPLLPSMHNFLRIFVSQTQCMPVNFTRFRRLWPPPPGLIRPGRLSAVVARSLARTRQHTPHR